MDNASVKKTISNFDIVKDEQLFKTLLESVNCIVWEYEFENDRFTYVSPQSLPITGYAPEEWTNFQSWLEMIDSRDREWAPAFCAEKTKEGVDHEFEYRLIRKDGQIIWMRDIATISRRDGKVRGLRGFLIDITAIKKAEEELETSKNMLKLVLDTIPVRVFWKDAESRYLGCNLPFAKDAGLQAPDDLIGRDDYSMSWKNEADLYRSDDKAVMREGVAKLNFEEPQSWPNGTKLVLRTSKIPLRDKDGKVFGVLGTYEDITVQKKAEEELRKAKILADSSNKAKSAFLATMSHEIRTPLTAIIGVSDLLAESKLPPEQLKKVGVLKQAGETLLSLVNEILDFSKVEAGQINMHISVFNLEELVHAACEMISVKASAKGVVFEWKIGEDVPAVLEGAGMRVKEVLLNLLSNAVKFTEPGGRVWLDVSLDSAGQAGSKQAKVVFKVVDTGVGIMDGRRHLVFEPFISDGSSGGRSSSGTGLGLAITKRLVELMGGIIWFDTRPGEGSVFACSIPFGVTKAQRLASAKAALAENDEAKKKEKERRILFAEDSEQIRYVIGQYFNNSHYMVDMADNGEAAANMFRCKQYDAVLMDLEMPILNGYDAIKIIRAYEKEKGLPSVPIIALSAHALKEHEVKSAEAGCSLHISKPVTKKDLFAAIAKAIDEKSVKSA